MKRILYSLAVGLLALTSCTTWDDAKTENYGAGPSVDITIAAIQPTDSAFNITITPGSGTTYYAYAISQGDQPSSSIDAYTLLKGGYGNSVVNTEKNPTLSIPVKNAQPNTTYQVYAVASNDKGIAGEVVVKSIKTTDVNAPKALSFKDNKDGSILVTFNQALIKGSGAVTGIYYKEWDWDNPVTLGPDDITVTVSGSTATLSVPEAPAGAFVLFSLGKGAFVDASGNESSALNSYYDENKDDFVGLWVRTPLAPFDIEDSNVTAPKDKSFSEWEDFVGKVTFDFDIFRNDTQVEDGDVGVVYQNNDRTAVYKLKADQWEVEGTTLAFSLPVAPEEDDIVSFCINEGVIFDVYGNPNNAYESNVTWKYSTFKPTKEYVLGEYSYSVTLRSDGKTYDLDGSFTISEYTGEDAEEGDVLIKGLYLDDSEIYAFYDLKEKKLFIPRYQEIGVYEYEGEPYGVLVYSAGNNKNIPFDITPEGLVSTDFALVYCDPDFEDILGWEVGPGETVFAKVKGSAKKKVSKAKVSKKASVKKNVKGTPRKVKTIRRK